MNVCCCRGGCTVVRRNVGKTFTFGLLSGFFFLCLCRPDNEAKERLFGWRVVKNRGGKVGRGAKLDMGSFFTEVGLVRMVFFRSRVRLGLTTRSSSSNIETPII